MQTTEFTNLLIRYLFRLDFNIFILFLLSFGHI